MLLALYSVAEAQYNSTEFVTTPIGKNVDEFDLKIDQSTPLDLYLSTEYIATTGKESLWEQINSYTRRFDSEKADREVSEERKRQILDNRILEVIIYMDAVAAVIVQNEKTPWLGYFPILVQLCRVEDGYWVSAGQDVNTSVEAAREKFTAQAENSLKELFVIERLKMVPHDAAPFVTHIRKHGRAPGDFLLDALAAHKIVIWGEVHRRRLSWDVLKGVVRNPRFVETTGTIFMELPSHAQARMDSFFASETMDTRIVFGIFGDEQPHGWYDRGEFEFLVELWKLNRTLPVEKRIKVVLVDFQIPYSDIQTTEELRNYPEKNRNTHMADMVERTVRSSTDMRSNLFIVGYTHAYKSSVPGLQGSVLTAGAQLSERFSGSEVFTIFQHSPRISNIGGNGGLIRDGIFDRVFAETGNVQVGFPLPESPFGAEPFDASLEIIYDSRAGSFADNFDGYVFFGPLAEEEGDYYLYDIFEEEFVREIKRRIAYMGLDGWYGGLKPDELTPERMIELFKKDSERKRWIDTIEK